MIPAPAAAPLLPFPFRTVFAALPDTAHGVHRPQDALVPGLDCLVDAALGTVTPWTDAEAAAGAAGFAGASSFSPVDVPYGVPHSRFWQVPCAVFVAMPPGHHAVYDYDMRLRARRGGAPAAVNVAHFSMFPTGGGQTVVALSAAISASCVPCAMRAAAEDMRLLGDDDDTDASVLPCWPSDLDGVADGSMRALYGVSKHFYSRVPPTLRIALNSLMTAVALDKMTEAQLCAGTYQPALLAWWHAALVACDAFAEGGEFGHLGPAQSLLEVAAAASLSADATRADADDAALAIDATTPFTASTSVAACGGGVTVDVSVVETAAPHGAVGCGGVAASAP